MPSAESYQAAALASLKTTDPAEAPQSIDAMAPHEAHVPQMKLDESKLVVGDTEGLPEEEKSAISEKPEKDLKPKKTLEQIAREKAAARMAKEQERPVQGLQSKLGPQGMHQLNQAIERNDVRGILSALGVKPGDVQFEATKDKLEEVDAPRADPRYEALEKKLAALENERQQEKMTQGRSKALDFTREMAKDPAFELIADEPEAMDQALKVVEDFIREHGEMPAETREESIKLGLELVSEKYKKEAERWAKVLTKVKKPDITQSESPEQSTRAVSDVGKSRTLTNSTSSAPVRPKTTPRTEADYHAAAIAALKQIP